MPITFDHTNFKDALSDAKDENNKELNCFIENISSVKEEEEKGILDMKFLAERLSDCIYYCYCEENVEVPFMAIELLHLLMGEEFMKKLVLSVKGGMFYYFGPSLFCEDYYIPFSRYFEQMGLARELYLTENTRCGYPLHYMCRESAMYHVGTEQIETVPRDIIEEGLTLQDKDGNCPLHITYADDVVTASTEIFLISYRKVLKYLSKFESYEKALLLKNAKGETPLHTIIQNCNCVKTIEFLLSTDTGKKAAAMKDNEGNTPYDLIKKDEEYYGVYGKEDTSVIQQLLELSTQCHEE